MAAPAPSPSTPDSDPDAAGTSLRRVTFNATPAAVKAIDELVDLDGVSRTDVINQALISMRRMRRLAREHGDVWIQDKDDNTHIVYLP